MRLVVDREVCQGHGRCLLTAPKVAIDLDIAGQPILAAEGELGPETEAEARLAVDNCPESALSIDEEG